MGYRLAILIDCMIFLSPFLDVLWMCMSAVFFLVELDYGILWLQNLLNYDLNGFEGSMPRFSDFAGCFLRM